MVVQVSKDQQMMIQALNSLLKKEVPFEVFTEAVEKQEGFSKEIWKKVAENGWLGVLAKGEMQTFEDISSLDLMYLCESFGKWLFPGPYSLVAGFIIPFLSQLELKNHQKELLSHFISGEKLVTAYLPRTENGNNGLEFEATNIEIIEEEYDRIQVRGDVHHVPFVQHADAFLLPIKSLSGSHSVALLNTDHEGIKIVSEQSHDLTKPQGTIVLDGVWISNENFIGDRTSDHRKLLHKHLNHYFICLNGEMVGGASEVLDRTVAYVKEREQFGVPVGSFQAVKHIAANMYAEIEKARSLNTFVASLYEQHPEEQFMNVASSRLFTTQMYKKVCEDAIQLHGGMGFTWEAGIHYWYKASMYHLYHITHPTVLNEYILQDLLSKQA